MPDSLSTLVFPIVASPAQNTSYGQIEVPFPCDITDVTGICTTAPGTAGLPIDILKNGTSIFAATAATVALRSPIAVGDTTIYVEFANNASPDLQPGSQLVCGADTFTLQPQTVSGTGKVTGGIQGTSKVDNATPVYSLLVAPAATAIHAAGVPITMGLPVIPVGAVESQLSANPVWSGTPTCVEGDVLQLRIPAMTATATAGLVVSVEVSQR